MQNGDLGLFYLVKTNDWTYQTWMARSKEEGRSFYYRRMCTRHEGDGVYVMNNDRAVRLSCGRIVLPLAYHRVIRLPENGRHYDYRAITCFLYSDDDGETFTESHDTLALNIPASRSGLQEPGVTVLQNGVLWAYMRTDMLAQYESFSMDRGDTGRRCSCRGFHRPARRFRSSATPARVGYMPCSTPSPTMWAATYCRRPAGARR